MYSLPAYAPPELQEGCSSPKLPVGVVRRGSSYFATVSASSARCCGCLPLPTRQILLSHLLLVATCVIVLSVAGDARGAATSVR